MSAEAIILGLVLMAVFLVLSAFFSSSETAFISLERVRVLHLAQTGYPGASKLVSRLEHPEKTLSTVLLGNNLVNTAAAALGTVMAVSWLDEGLGVIVSTAGVTVLLLIFGEMIPKTFASRHPEWLAFRYQRPFCLVEWILRPISVLLHWIGIAIIKLSGAKAGARDLVSPELLQSVITAGQQAGTVEEEEATILRKVLGFGDRRVNEVMTPRNEVVWMNEETTLSTFLDIYVQLPHPRFPVYKESVDNVVGILHTQDVIKAMHNNEIQQDTPLLRLGQPAIFVPETKPLDDLFVEMRASGVQMALAVDEYGGVAGLVTMNQLLTAIIGRFGEEGEEGEEEYESLGEGGIPGGWRNAGQRGQRGQRGATVEDSRRRIRDSCRLCAGCLGSHPPRGRDHQLRAYEAPSDRDEGGQDREGAGYQAVAASALI